MPQYFCDYCELYLTHDSMAARKAHNNGYKHKDVVRRYYERFVALPPPPAMGGGMGGGGGGGGPGGHPGPMMGGMPFPPQPHFPPPPHMRR